MAGFPHEHLIDFSDYSADDIMLLLETAHKFKEVNERRIKKVPVVQDGKLVGTLSRRNIMRSLVEAIDALEK